MWLSGTIKLLVCAYDLYNYIEVGDRSLMISLIMNILTFEKNSGFINKWNSSKLTNCCSVFRIGMFKNCECDFRFLFYCSENISFVRFIPFLLCLFNRFQFMYVCIHRIITDERTKLKQYKIHHECEGGINRIHHLCSVGTGKSKPEGLPFQWETRLTKFPTERWTWGLGFAGTTEQ